ncbi:4'-phosphopantetheinyl transferase superfamily protein [Gorillibacterium sp. CAU 1737]|uniref:4'-phosphopantetheinyl transferase superfamily protein n=1 Tax=Gorillibacterium sp. CAU 1737 TaxID=3140362 RepID=UPI00326061D8
MKPCLVVFSLDNWTIEYEGLLSLLSEREVKSLQVRGTEQEVFSLLAGYTLVKSLIRFRYHADGELRRERGGKPYLASPNWKGSFSVSHSGNMVVCGIHPTGQIGVDVERPRPIMDELLDECLSDQEKAFCQESSTEETKRLRFFRFWTLKEAYLKAQGSRFGEVAFSELDFSRMGYEPESAETGRKFHAVYPQLMEKDKEPNAALQFSHFELPEGYSVAACCGETFSAPELLSPHHIELPKPVSIVTRIQRGLGLRKVPGLWSSFFS